MQPDIADAENPFGVAGDSGFSSQAFDQNSFAQNLFTADTGFNQREGNAQSPFPDFDTQSMG